MNINTNETNSYANVIEMPLKSQVIGNKRITIGILKQISLEDIVGKIYKRRSVELLGWINYFPKEDGRNQNDYYHILYLDDGKLKRSYVLRYPNRTTYLEYEADFINSFLKENTSGEDLIQDILDNLSENGDDFILSKNCGLSNSDSFCGLSLKQLKEMRSNMIDGNCQAVSLEINKIQNEIKILISDIRNIDQIYIGY